MSDNSSKKPKYSWDGVQDDDQLRKAALERLVEGYHSLEERIEAMPKVIGKAQQEQIDLTTSALLESLGLVKQAIEGLPDDLDAQTTSMQAYIYEAAAAVDHKVRELETKTDHINTSALKMVSTAMLESSTTFNKILVESKDTVLESFKEELNSIISESKLKETIEEITSKLSEDESNTKQTLEKIESTTKETLGDLKESTNKTLENLNKSTKQGLENFRVDIKEDAKELVTVTRQSAWLIIGATAVINIASMLVTFALLR